MRCEFCGSEDVLCVIDYDCFYCRCGAEYNEAGWNKPEESVLEFFREFDEYHNASLWKKILWCFTRA
jgi:hypothetical protein